MQLIKPYTVQRFVFNKFGNSGLDEKMEMTDASTTAIVGNGRTMYKVHRRLSMVAISPIRPISEIIDDMNEVVDEIGRLVEDPEAGRGLEQILVKLEQGSEQISITAHQTVKYARRLKRKWSLRDSRLL